MLNNQMAIPPGTYVQGQIDTLTRPGWLSPHAQFQIHFTKIIFANGYTVELAGPQNVTTGQPPAQPASAASGTPLAPADDVIAAVVNAYVLVSSASDVLLDNGSQVEMVLQVPLRLNAAKVAAAVRQSNHAPLAQFKSATLCRPIFVLGTPGTVIPGTSGMVIPQGRGIVPCPSPPILTSNPKVQNYRESFQIDAPVQVSGVQLSAGSYQVSWEGSGPLAQVDILQNGNIVISVQARVVLLNRKSPADAPGTRTNSGGSVFLQSLRFAGQTFALYFDQGDA